MAVVIRTWQADAAPNSTDPKFHPGVFSLGIRRTSKITQWFIITVGTLETHIAFQRTSQTSSLETILSPRKPLYNTRHQPIQPHRRSHHPGYKHRLFPAINGVYAPPRHMSLLQSMLIRVCLAHVHCTPIEGTCAEFTLYGGREEVSKCDERVVDWKRMRLASESGGYLAEFENLPAGTRRALARLGSVGVSEHCQS